MGNFAPFNLIKKGTLFGGILGIQVKTIYFLLSIMYKGMRCLVDISISIVSRHCNASAVGVIVELEGTGTKYES